MIGRPINKIIANPVGKKNQKKVLLGINVISGDFHPHLKFIDYRKPCSFALLM
jgi:hypothetical protein